MFIALTIISVVLSIAYIISAVQVRNEKKRNSSKDYKKDVRKW